MFGIKVFSKKQKKKKKGLMLKLKLQYFGH